MFDEIMENFIKRNKPITFFINIFNFLATEVLQRKKCRIYIAQFFEQSFGCEGVVNAVVS